MLVDRYEVELVAQSGAPHEAGSHVQGNRDQQVEGDSPLVVGGQLTGVGVDVLDEEVGLQLDVPLAEQRAQPGGRDRLGERVGQRRHEGELDIVAYAQRPQVRISKESELQRSHGAFDRHLDDVDDEPSAGAGEPRQRLAQGKRTVQCVELMDRLAPQRAEHAGRLVGARLCAGRDDEEVIAERAAIGECDRACDGIDAIDLAVDEFDTGRQ